MGKRRYNAEEEAFLIGFIPGHTYQESADAFNKAFPDHYRKVSRTMINAFCERHGLTTGNNHRYPKGHIPANKGKKVPREKQSIAGQFKPGENRRTLPLGSERLEKSGYLWVKVGQPRKWRKKHLVVWEQEHSRLPPGHVILFRDGNRLNCNIDNLALVTKSEHTYIIKTGIKWESPEIFDSLLMTARLRMKIIDKETKKK